MGELASGCKREDHHTGIEWVGLWGVISVHMDCYDNAVASIFAILHFLDQYYSRCGQSNKRYGPGKSLSFDGSVKGITTNEAYLPFISLSKGH